MNVFESLKRQDFRPSKSDKLLAEYIDGHFKEIPYLAIAEIAEGSGVGEATITRFAKKMGYPSLSAFKVALASINSQPLEPAIIDENISRDEPLAETSRKLLAADINALKDTLNNLPAKIITNCVAVLREAKRIIFVGLGNSGFTAADSAYRFFRIGLPSCGYDNSHSMLMAAALAGKGDVFVGISQSGESPEVVKTIELAKKNGAKTIVITAAKESKLAKAADQLIVYTARENRLESGAIATKMAQFFILDIIYTQIVKETTEISAERKRQTTTAIDLLAIKD